MDRYAATFDAFWSAYFGMTIAEWKKLCEKTASKGCDGNEAP